MGGTVAFKMSDFDDLGYDYATAIKIQADGKILVAGNAGSNFRIPTYSWGVARLNNDGSFDQSFNGTGMLILDYPRYPAYVTSMTLQNDGKIILGGYGEKQPGINDFALARITVDGHVDKTFADAGYKVLAVSPGDNLIHHIAISGNELYATGFANFRNELGIVARFNLHVSSGTTTFFKDADGDGYGNPEVKIEANAPPTGYVTDSTDCDDTKASVHPGAKEVCNGIDDNCDGMVDEGFPDTDGDHIADCMDQDDDNDGVPDFMDCAPLDKNNNKVLVCHKGHTLCISRNALKAHLKHGDKEGSCNSKTASFAEGDTQVVLERNPANPATFSITNYPNPFTATTTIRYEIPVNSKVSIKVYDLMGRVVTTLVDENKKAGTFTVSYKGAHLNKGTLYYKMIATSKDGQFQQTGKMVQIQR